MNWINASAGLLVAAMASNGWAGALNDTLTDTLTSDLRALDAQLFDSFNRCAEPAQLALHGDFFATDVEFYHDQGGVTWDRASMLANTRNNACGNYTRQLQANSFRAFPVATFGAITQGVHSFCRQDSGACEGEADFVMVWQQTPDGWRVTRVLSFGHRSMPAADQSAGGGQ